MIDTHCHLNLDPLIKDYQNYYDQAVKAGVNKFIVPGVNAESSIKARSIASELEAVYAAIGLHPHEAEQVLTAQSTQEVYHWLLELGGKEDVIAIGECGLDYFRLPDDKLQAKHIRAAQKKLFKLHLKVALELDKPILVHVRDANEDAITLLESHKPKGVLHCFSGEREYLEKAIDLGLYVSFAGNVTFKNADHLRQMLRLVPQDKLLLETDAPFLNPRRGKWPTTPADIAITYQQVAQQMDLSLEDLENRISANSSSLFGI